MIELAELSLWAALPLVLLGSVLSISGGWTGRGDLAAIGGRAAEASTALMLVALAGLGYALVAVRLDYIYVAAFSGFQFPARWRLAALWSGPGGGALTLTTLIVMAGALSFRSQSSRQAAARTGALGALATVGLLMVLARAQPFAQTPAPALEGAGLPIAIRDLAWQAELWASYVATAAAAFVFSGVIGEQLVESPSQARSERVAVRAVGAVLSIALIASAWRAYAATGELLGRAGASAVLAHGAPWLLTVAYLHAPAGGAVPVWAARWRRILGVALFPAALGSTASLLSSGAGVASPRLWAAGLAVGIISGAMAGMTRSRWGLESAAELPGFGFDGFAGGVLTLCFAGYAAVWALLGRPSALSGPWPFVAWGVIGLGGVSAWSLSRPLAGRARVWMFGIAAALVAAVAFGLVHGGPPIHVAVLVGLAAAVVAAFVIDVLRVGRARPLLASARPGGDLHKRAVLRVRARRRLASAAAHLGLALVAVGLATSALSRSQTEVLEPGETIAMSLGRRDSVSVTYLGLSRYQLERLDKRVASFLMKFGEERPELVTATMTFDLMAQRHTQAPALVRHGLDDVVLGIAGMTAGEEITCVLGLRPFARVVWLGALMLVASMVLAPGLTPALPSREDEEAE